MLPHKAVTMPIRDDQWCMSSSVFPSGLFRVEFEDMAKSWCIEEAEFDGEAAEARKDGKRLAASLACGVFISSKVCATLEMMRFQLWGSFVNHTL